MNNLRLLHLYRKLSVYSNSKESGRDCSNIDINVVIKELLPILKEYLNSQKFEI